MISPKTALPASFITNQFDFILYMYKSSIEN